MAPKRLGRSIKRRNQVRWIKKSKKPSQSLSMARTTVAEPKHEERNDVSTKQAVDEGKDHTAMTVPPEDERLGVRVFGQPPHPESAVLPLPSEAKREREPKQTEPRLGITEGTYFPASEQATATQPPTVPPVSPVQPIQEAQQFQQVPQLQQADQLAKPSDSRGRAGHKPENINSDTIVKSGGDRKTTKNNTTPQKQQQKTNKKNKQTNRNGTRTRAEESPAPT